jgi:hypothetical protein
MKKKNMASYDYLENETLQNIQNLLEEKDIIISELLKACKYAKAFLDGNPVVFIDQVQKRIEQAIAKAEGGV